MLNKLELITIVAGTLYAEGPSF